MAFTLAHLSDPHLAPMPVPRWSELIGKRVTGYLNWQRRRRFIHDPDVLEAIVTDLAAQAADHITVTGDIANIALRGEFTCGRNWLQRLGSAKDVTFVPGNHDVYVPEAAVYAARQWEAYMCDDEGIGGFPFLRRRGAIVLIGLSTAVPTAPFLATGWLGAKQLAALSALLNEIRSEKLFRVVLIHHPPVSEAGRHKRLLDADIFVRVIARYGADLVLHGHDHLHMINWLKGPNGARVPAVGVPSASAALGTGKDAAAYNLYRIDGAPSAWRCELISRGITPDGRLGEQKRFMLVGSA